MERGDCRAVSRPEKRLDEELTYLKSSSKTTRISDPSDKVKPGHSSSRDKSGKPTPSSPSGDEGQSGSSSSGLKRRLTRKTTAATSKEDDSKQFLDELETRNLKSSQMILEKRWWKGDDVNYSPSSDDKRWEKVRRKPGNGSREPRRISVPSPRSEAQALTPAYRKMIKRFNSISKSYFYVESS